MLSRDYLALKSVRLKAGAEWRNGDQGISFVFLQVGMGRYQSGKTSQNVASGDLFVFNSSAGAKIRASESDDLAFSSFSICFEHLFPLFAAGEISALQNVTERFKSLRLYSAATPLAKECHRLVREVSGEFNLNHRIQLLRVAGSVLTAEFDSISQYRLGHSRTEERMLQVFENLTFDHLISLSVPELAERFNCSRRHLNRLFQQHFGYSVAAFRMEMRLLKAASLLRDPDAKVINVAEQCGFNHLGLFNTCFKRRFGSSPGQWRKLMAAAEGQSNHAAPTSMGEIIENAFQSATNGVVNRKHSAAYTMPSVIPLPVVSQEMEFQRAPSMGGL